MNKNKTLEQLHKLCPKANKLSLFHLSIAINTKHKYYCTSDKYIHKKSDVLKKKFNIDIVSDPFINTTGGLFNYYI